MSERTRAGRKAEQAKKAREDASNAAAEANLAAHEAAMELEQAYRNNLVASIAAWAETATQEQVIGALTDAIGTNQLANVARDCCWPQAQYANTQSAPSPKMPDDGDMPGPRHK